MTLRAWLLAIAAALAAVVAALTWPDDSGPLPVVIGEHTLISADLAVFQKVCTQIAADREAYESGQGGAAIPVKLPMGRFAHVMSATPVMLEGTCGRAGVSVKDFLEIVAAMDRAEGTLRRLTAFEAEYERRAEKAEAVARAMAELGQEPPPVPSPDAKPSWFNEIAPQVRDSLPAWREIGAKATATWSAVMKLPGANAREDDEDEDEPK